MNMQREWAKKIVLWEENRGERTSNTQAIHLPADHPAGDGALTRDHGQMAVVVPPGIADLDPIDPDLTCLIIGNKAQHQLSGKGPGLAAEVADVLDFDGHLLGDLSVQGRFHRFARFDKAGEGTVHPFGEAGGAGQQHLFASGDQRNDAGRDSRIPGQ